MKIEYLFKGNPAPLEKAPDIISAIQRQKTDRLKIHSNFIEGDEVANKIHHGGPLRVLHHYSLDHYKFWRKSFPEIAFEPGSMGENLSAPDLTEKNVCLGDVYQIGAIIGEVTEPRKPCATINHQFQVPGLARQVQEQSMTGWFYQIKHPGTIFIDDKIQLLDRPYPDLTLDRCIRALLIQPDKKILEQMLDVPFLSESWKRPARNWLATGQMADDRVRLGELNPP